MLWRRILAATIVSALLLPALAGCLLLNLEASQTMACCKHFDCTGGHQNSSCFTAKAPRNGSLSTPRPFVSLAAPALSIDAIAVAAPSSPIGFHLIDPIKTPQHPPPELYTLHLALLI